MTKSDFNDWVLSAIGRDDIKSDTPVFKRWVESARRKVQQAHDYKAMEKTVRIALQPVGTNCIQAPCDVKDLELFRIVDSKGTLILVPKYIRGRNEFQRLLTSQDVVQILDDPDIFVVADIPQEALGYPLAVGWWDQAFWLFPPVGSIATSAFLELDYIRFFPFDVSGEEDEYSDFLFDEGADATFYRVLIETTPFFRDQFQAAALKELFKDAETMLMRTDAARRSEYGLPISMDPTG